MLKRLQIQGGKRLEGTVTISGAKNAAAAILPAALISDETCVIENLPHIADVELQADIFHSMGVDAAFENGRMTIDPTKLNTLKADFESVRQMRASYYLVGALLGKYGEAEAALPGGCEIGARPIDLHIKGFTALGADVRVEHGILKATAPNGLTGCEIFLDFASVGATINIMLAAVRAEGMTIIHNAAREPHVVDTANFLNCIGASVKGAGTATVRISGRSSMHETTYAVIPDQIETGTYMIAAAATHGDVTLRNVIPQHLEAVSAKLMEMGVSVAEGDDGREFFLNVRSDREHLRGANIKTLPYPGFPTDLQQPLTALLTTCESNSIVTENLFEDRFKHIPCLLRMGADISVAGRVAVIQSVNKLTGASVSASDLRAGAALVIAGLMADGETTIDCVDYIDRGYEHIESKLAALGADIRRVN